MSATRKNKIHRADVMAAQNTACPSCGYAIPPYREDEVSEVWDRVRGAPRAVTDSFARRCDAGGGGVGGRREERGENVVPLLVCGAGRDAMREHWRPRSVEFGTITVPVMYQPAV